MIKVEPERNKAFDTCQSCGERGPLLSIMFKLVYNFKQSSGTKIHICEACKDELGRQCQGKAGR